ncbi:MAG: hypothetical protein JSW06_03860 [Thermoplasmatales archaeon]|nr:MAG: hypothetical protein JSW06_03860 [Thermoplasmatales archaeon]
MLGISTYVLADWEDDKAKTENTLQGKNRKLSDNQIQFVVEQYQVYSQERKKVKIAAFMKDLTQTWKKQTWLTPAPSRKTVEDILIANDCRKPKTIKKRSYYESIKRYFPHVQSVLDGKEVVVTLKGNDFSFVLEYSKDMATDAICGTAVGLTETSDLVKEAFEKHSQNYQRPLAALVDNGKGNHKAAIDLGNEGTLFIKAFPYRPESKAQIEGEFGLFERKVSRIVIEGDTEQQQAMSILKNTAEVYARLRNQTPRCSVCPFTPKKLMKAKLNSVDAETTYNIFKEQQQIKEKQKEQRMKISQEHNDLIESIVRDYRLSGNLYRFKKSLRWLEISTLEKAELQFALYSQKDNFDPAKRTMAYFAAIANNMQQEKDRDRKEQTARRRYGLSEQYKRQRQDIEAELKRKKELQALEKQPNLKLLNAIQSHMNLPESLRENVNLFKGFIDEAIFSIQRKKKQRRKTLIANAHKEIMGLNKISIEDRYEWINYVNERISFLENNKAEVVTPN